MTSTRYELLPADRPADDLEQELLAVWREERLFERTLLERADSPRFVFYDGPPTANGRPGIHHVFARTIKDLFCRHRTMTGHLVPRKAGWDTHGLPVEIEVEKALGLSGKPDIEAFGVEAFNARCRESVWTYRKEWERLVERVANWMDYDQPYVTYTNDYIESEWWALKTLYERGLLYRGHKILPYCSRCGTALSSHEVAQGYEDVEDPSVYVALDLVDGPQDGGRGTGDGSGGAARRRLLVWTTTPWTLVSNVALAVHPDLEYVELRKKTGADWTIILAAARAMAVLGDDYNDRWDVVQRLTGRELEGRRYRRPLDWVPFGEDTGEHEVIVTADFVSADDGSGIVHMAPAFGADDYATGKKHGLVMLQPVNGRGRFDDEVPVVGGMWVKDADARIIEELKARDVLWKAAKLLHAYPHCWRCKTPLLYYARVSWFVRTTQFKDDMMARNAAMAWHPREVGEGRFGEWLKNNIDWAISRDRYWGTPLPVWVNDADPSEIEVIGSYAELARAVRDDASRRLRSTQAVHRRLHLACAIGDRDDASRPRSDRRLVRLGIDAVRTVALPVREPRAHGPAVSGRLHRRGARPDPRLVLLAARDRHRIGRRAAGKCCSRRRTDRRTVPGGGRERPGAGCHGREDVEEPGQRGESVGCAGDIRRRRGAPLPRRLEPTRYAQTVRCGRDPRHVGALPRHAQEHLQRDLRAVCELRLGTVGARSGGSRIARCSTGGSCRGSRPSRSRCRRRSRASTPPPRRER